MTTAPLHVTSIPRIKAIKPNKCEVVCERAAIQINIVSLYLFKFHLIRKTSFLIIFLRIQRHDFYVLDSSNFSFSSYLIPVVDFPNIKNVQALKFHIFTRSLSICHGLDSSDKRPYRFGCNCGIINRCSYTYVLIKNVQRYFKLEQSNTWDYSLQCLEIFVVLSLRSFKKWSASNLEETDYFIELSNMLCTIWFLHVRKYLLEYRELLLIWIRYSLVEKISWNLWYFRMTRESFFLLFV